MANLTSTEISKLNKMNRAAQDVSLGTILSVAPIGGVVTASAPQANASAVIIDTGLDANTGYTVQRFNSGSALLSYVTNTSGSLVISAVTGGDAIVAGDVFNWLAW